MAAEPEPDPADLSLELVERIQGGDSRAWEALYLRYRDKLLFSIRCRLGPGLRSRLQSEDILHSVVKDVMRDLAHFEPRGRSSLEHYLHVCVLNKIRDKADYFGAGKRRGDVPLSATLADRLPGVTDARELQYLDADRYERLERCLATLPENLREVLVLRRIENLSNTEAADALGKTPQAASKLYNRALARLGVLMSGGGG